jgi:hypothetical protein
MRDGVRFPVTRCKMTEMIIQADCDSGGKVKPWRIVAMEKLIPIAPSSCMEVSTSRRVTLFNRRIALTGDGMAMETLEERANCGPKGQCPSGGSLIKKTIARGGNDIVPNYVAGGMDTTEGAYVWNDTTRNCPGRAGRALQREAGNPRWRYGDAGQGK